MSAHFGVRGHLRSLQNVKLSKIHAIFRSEAIRNMNGNSLRRLRFFLRDLVCG
jgi:hypothetical protein